METIKKILGIGREKIAEETEADINEKRFSSTSMFKKFARLFTGQWRPVEGPNMPKYQPCPECHHGCKRDRKTMAGAFYKCNRCDSEFLVVNKSAAAAFPERVMAGAI